MIKIELDCNSDMVSVYQNDELIYMVEAKYPMQWGTMFTEIFNRIPGEIGVQLTKIDENVRTTLEEW